MRTREKNLVKNRKLGLSNGLHYDLCREYFGAEKSTKSLIAKRIFGFMAFISMNKYAQLRGVSAMAVSKAVKSGRLVRSVLRDAEGKPKGIDPDVADIEWTRNTNPVHGGKREVESTPAPAAPKPEPKVHRVKDEAAHATAIEVDAVTNTLNSSRAKHETYKAELARLEFEKQSGILVEAEAVRKQAFITARRVRDGMLNIPDRISQELAGMADAFLIHQRIAEEIRLVLNEMADMERDEGVQEAESA
jgi:hypothetical protein